MYEESSSRFGTLDGRLRSLGSSEMVNCACSEWVISRSCEGIGMKPNLHVGWRLFLPGITTSIE